MVTLKVKVTFLEDILGTASANPEIHRDYIASNAPTTEAENGEVEAIPAEEQFEKSMTVFPRDKNGNPFLWDYQWKGFLKDSFKALRKLPKTECSKIKSYKQEIDSLIFVYPRKIPIEMAGEIETCQRPLRASTPQGERVALASSESIPSGSSVTIDIECLADGDEKAVIEALNYGKRRGFGQWRNSGKGRFEYEILERKVEELAV